MHAKQPVPVITFLLVFLLFNTLAASAQVRTRRFILSQPAEALGLLGARMQGIPTLQLPAVALDSLLRQDEQQAKEGYPFRFGLNRAVSVDLLKDGTRDEQENYRIYAYRIEAAGAFSLNLIFDRLRLKEGARLFLYNGDRTMVVGPITEAQNLSSGEFWTDLVQGSVLQLELQEPLRGRGNSELHLSSVVHGYKNTFPEKLFGQAGTCHPNLICFPQFQPEADGVAMVLLANGSRLCTGSMINSVRQTFRSYFLSAFHCLDLNSSQTADADEIRQVENWLLRFNYQSPTCTPTQDDTEFVTLNGSTYRAGYASSDFLLLELNRQVPPEVNTTYNGWNRGAATTSNNFSIHHPRGDVKKISFTNADTEVSGYGRAGDTHLISFWGTLGVTDPGSSGSPLFDGNRRIVGQLHGGPSFCGATGTSLRDYYGRFFTSWTGGGTPASSLRPWLDPENTGLTTVDGVKPIVVGPATLTTTGTFSLNVRAASSVSWSVTGGSNLVRPQSGTGNVASLTAVGTTSSLQITFQVQDGQAYPIAFSRVFSTSVTPAPPGGGLSLLVPDYDCVTGAIRFRTSGGNGTPIIYTAVGVQRASPGSSTGVVEPGLRADPKPLLISATQSGTTVSQPFDFAAFCSRPPVVPPLPGGGLSLLVPDYDCVTGAIRFRTSGGDGTPIIYTAVGVQRASPGSSTGVVEPGLRADPKPLLISATQSGTTVSQPFDFAAFCSRPPVVPPLPGGGLSLLVPDYDCVTGAIRFRTSGGDSTPILYTAVGVQRASPGSSTGVVEPGLRADPKPLLISATQSGTTVSQPFDFAAFCSGSSRLAYSGKENKLLVTVLGNPLTNETLSLEISGVAGEELRVRVVTTTGEVLSETLVDKASTLETFRIRLGRRAGVYLIQVQAGTHRQTVRVVRME